MNIRLFGDQVLFKPIDEEVGGSLILPQRQNKKYELGQVLVLGDGQKKDALGNPKKVEMLVNVGDLIWFQVNPYAAFNNSVHLDGKTYMTIIQNDMIARLKEPKVSIENFEILGDWVLLTTFEDKAPHSGIIIPGTADEASRSLRYKVSQVGQLVDSVVAGEEVIIDKKMANLVSINHEPFFYISRHSILGIVKSSLEVNLE